MPKIQLIHLYVIMDFYVSYLFFETSDDIKMLSLQENAIYHSPCTRINSDYLEIFRSHVIQFLNNPNLYCIGYRKKSLIWNFSQNFNLIYRFLTKLKKSTIYSLKIEIFLFDSFVVDWKLLDYVGLFLEFNPEKTSMCYTCIHNFFITSIMMQLT